MFGPVRAAGASLVLSAFLVAGLSGPAQAQPVDLTPGESTLIPIADSVGARESE